MVQWLVQQEGPRLESHWGSGWGGFSVCNLHVLSMSALVLSVYFLFYCTVFVYGLLPYPTCWLSDAKLPVHLFPSYVLIHCQ